MYGTLLMMDGYSNTVAFCEADSKAPSGVIKRLEAMNRELHLRDHKPTGAGVEGYCVGIFFHHQ
jgi:hypothetical protein